MRGTERKTHADRTGAIRALNDRLRIRREGGQIFLTRGVTTVVSQTLPSVCSLICERNYAASSAKVWKALAPVAGI